MKSLKARFKKADVSAIPGNVGTRGPALGCSQGREDLGISPTMPPVSQGHRDLRWDTGWSLTPRTAVPRRLALPPWLMGSSPQCAPSAPRAIVGSGAEQRRGKRVPGSLPVPFLGQVPVCQLPQPVEPACRCSSIIQHQHGTGPQRAEGDSTVPSALGGTGLGTWGHRLKPLTLSLGDPPAGGALCLSLPTLPWTRP